MTPVTGYVDDHETIALLQRLLRINTENPPGNEEPAARMLADYLAPLGFETDYHEAAPARTSLVARLRGTGGGRTLVMNGHLDIGPIGTGWTRDPLGGEIESGRIYGRGVSDMKSGLAAMVSAARAVSLSGMPRRGDLILMPTADESSGGRLGMGHLVKTLRGLRADMAVVGEPTVGDVCLAHRGAVWAEVVVIGKAGQASRPASGINAIMAMGRVLRAFETDLAPRLAAKTHPLLPAPTLICRAYRRRRQDQRHRGALPRRGRPPKSSRASVPTTSSRRSASARHARWREPARASRSRSRWRSLRRRSPPMPRWSPNASARSRRSWGGARPARQPGLHRRPLVQPRPRHPGGGLRAVVPSPAGREHLGHPRRDNYVEDVLTGTRVYAQLIANVIGGGARRGLRARGAIRMLSLEGAIDIHVHSSPEVFGRSGRRGDRTAL